MAMDKMVTSIDDLWTIVLRHATREKLIGGFVVLFSSFYLLRLRRILALRRKRLAKSKTAIDEKQKLKNRMDSHENREALRRIEEITNLSLQDLIDELSKGDLKPSDCMVAYLAKAAAEDAKYNFMTECLTEAESEAKSLDDVSNKGPLFGVPVSFKDCYNVKGYEGCCGFSKMIGVVSPEDSVLVKVVKKQGAIPFMKTNVPQTMYSFGSENPIYGTTVNPHDVTRSPGGSSSGEAAALAAKASILGFGTDIGGSCRIPAAFCGVCGLKPSLSRLSKKGLLPFCSGNSALKGNVGPLARDVEGLAIAMKSVLVSDMFELDPDVVPLPFREEVYKSQKPLRIGYFVDHNAFATYPASKRAVLLAKETLEKMGHQLVLWEPYDFRHGMTFYPSGMFADSGIEFLDSLKDDQVSSCIRIVYATLKLPIFVKKFLSWVIRPFSPDYSQIIYGLCGLGSVSDEWKYFVSREEWKQENIKRWKDDHLDAVICPSMGPALPIGSPPKAIPLISFVAPFNLLNFTAGNLPVTTVTQADEDGMKDFPIRNFAHSVVKKGLSKDTVGLPVSVQVVTLPYQDEQCLRVMKDIESGLKGQIQ